VSDACDAHAPHQQSGKWHLIADMPSVSRCFIAARKSSASLRRNA
jgi:hypothetical protein